MPAPRSRQSRLSFNPLPSSSPASKEYNKQIRDRAAAITIEGSARKKRKLRDSSDGNEQLDGANKSMPTPVATLDRKGNRPNELGIPPADTDDSDDIPLGRSQRTGGHKRRKTSREQRLDFTNTRDADSFDSPVKLSSSARPDSSARAGVFGTQRKRATVISSDDESEDEELPSPAKLVANKKTNRAKRLKRSPGGDKRQTRSTRRSSQAEPESEDNVHVSSPRQLPLEVDSEEEEEDEMPSTMATQRRRRAQRQESPDSFISSSPPPGPIDSDDDLQIIEAQPKQRRRSKDEVSEDEDAAPVTPGRRKLKRPQRQLNQQEADDLAEDLDFLGPSSDVESSARKPRNTLTTQKEARLSALEKLKRKRSTQPGHSQPIVVDDDDEDEDDNEEENYSYDDDEDAVDEPEQPPISSRQYFTANEQDEAFIESGEEEDGTLGAPDSSMPIEFTKFARMKGKQLFPNAVEWMVQKKINPAFSISDELYDLTFRKLDDEVRGLAGSKFMSSVWKEEFVYALKARPEIAYDELDGIGEDLERHCGACNRKDHHASFRVQFQGKPYHRKTLEEVDNKGGDSDEGVDRDSNGDKDDDDDDDDDDKPSWDAEGREIVPVSKIFYLGRICKGNAQSAHALLHWKHHLNDWVVVWLAKNGYLARAERLRRDASSERKLRKLANKIADRMEKDGVVKRLWKDFRGNIDTARDS